MASPIASTRSVGATTRSDLPDWMSGLGQYATPNVNLGTTSASSMVGEPLQATIANAPSLEKVANIVNQINQQAYLSAPGRAQELANIQRWQSGQLDPTVYENARLQAAQQYGNAGFGVDSPAWQASVQRALGLQRQALEEKGATALEQMYRGLPTTDVTKYTTTPSDYAAAQNAAQQRQLQLAQLQQQAGLENARLAQERALSQQELAFKQEQLRQQQLQSEAELYARYGLRGLGPETGYDWQGNFVQGGGYQQGWTDVFGKFHPGMRP